MSKEIEQAEEALEASRRRHAQVATSIAAAILFSGPAPSAPTGLAVASFTYTPASAIINWSQGLGGTSGSGNLAQFLSAVNQATIFEIDGPLSGTRYWLGGPGWRLISGASGSCES